MWYLNSDFIDDDLKMIILIYPIDFYMETTINATLIV